MMYHDGSHSWIWNDVGELYINNAQDNGDIIFRSDDGAGNIAEYFRVDGDDTLVYFSKGAQFASGSYVKLLDGIIAYFGTGNDLQIYHDGSNRYIDETGTGNLIINGSTVSIRAKDKELAVVCNANGSVDG